MNEDVIKYRKLAASEAVLALDETLPEEEQKRHMDACLKFNEIYMNLLKHEHDYHDPVREKKERNTDLIKTFTSGILNLICYGGVAAIYGYVDTHDRLPGAVLKDTMKKVSFHK